MLTFFDPRDTALIIALALLPSITVWRFLPATHWRWAIFLMGVFSIGFSARLDPLILGDFFKYNRVSLGILLILILFLSTLTRRLAFSILVSLVIIGGVAAISLTKYRYTGVPLLWLDLHLAASTWQLLLRMQAESTGILALLLIGLLVAWRQDRPVSLRRNPKAWSLLLLSGAIFSTTTLASGHVATGNDILSTGLEDGNWDPWAIFIGSIHGIGELQVPASASWDPLLCCFSAPAEHLHASQIPRELPHIVVVLEESTFPPTNLADWKGRPPGFFEHTHPLIAEVAGGGTWIAEYSLLHGVSPWTYGPAANFINFLGPGKLDGRLPVFLKQLGYKTTTVYPVHHRFYGARAFHRSLGMDEFIDCAEIPGCANKEMHDIRDQALLDTAAQKLTGSRHPAFVFLPTMRQHSPHNGAAQPVPACDRLNTNQCRVLSVYTDRLNKSITEFDDFLRQLQKINREVVVLAFGDHIPADIYRHFAANQFLSDRKRTFFTVWSSRRGYLTEALVDRFGRPPAVHNAYLDLVIARASGFESPYFNAKEMALRSCGGEFCMRVVNR